MRRSMRSVRRALQPQRRGVSDPMRSGGGRLSQYNHRGHCGSTEMRQKAVNGLC